MCVALDCCSHLKCITGTYISTFVIRAAQSAKHYRARAVQIKDLKNQNQELSKHSEDAREQVTKIAKRYTEHETESSARIKRMKVHHESERESLSTLVQEARSALVNEEYVKREMFKTPLGLAKGLELSPGTQKKVSLNSYSGLLRGNSSTRFLGRIQRSLTPLVQAICALPKFEDGKTDVVVGVAKIVLNRIMKSGTAGQVVKIHLMDHL